MADLDTLRPEVREAINRTDMTVEMFDTLVTVNRDDYDIIRAELLRLTDECTTLKAQSIYPRAELLANFAAANERADKAEAELATAQNTINAQQGTMGALKRKLALSEGELAALKARIADSPIASLVYGQGDLLAVISAENPDDWAGKRVRLVVEE